MISKHSHRCTRGIAQAPCAASKQDPDNGKENGSRDCDANPVGPRETTHRSGLLRWSSPCHKVNSEAAVIQPIVEWTMKQRTCRDINDRPRFLLAFMGRGDGE